MTEVDHSARLNNRIVSSQTRNASTAARLLIKVYTVLMKKTVDSGGDLDYMRIVTMTTYLFEYTAWSCTNFKYSIYIFNYHKLETKAVVNAITTWISSRETPVLVLTDNSTAEAVVNFRNPKSNLFLLISRLPTLNSQLQRI